MSLRPEAATSKWSSYGVANRSGCGGPRGPPTGAAWAATLPDLCAKLRDDPHGPAGLGTEVARALAARSGDWLLDAVRRAASIATPSRRDTTLESLAVPTLAVLRAGGCVGALAFRDQIVEAVLDPPLALVPMLVQVIRRATPLPSDDRQLAGVDSIAAHCRTELDKELSLPPRAPDDWSITGFASGTCCADCTVLEVFLVDPSIERTTWPLAKPRRQHLHQRIDEAELPVTHATIRQGSPHQLVLPRPPTSTSEPPKEEEHAWNRWPMSGSSSTPPRTVALQLVIRRRAIAGAGSARIGHL